ncbi:MAG: AsmA family protein [Burkholderiaceae bacterium]
MRRLARWVLLTFVLSCVLLSVMLFLLQRWIATDDFRDRVQAQASEALGREVRLGALAVDVWPLPGVALNRVEIVTRPVIRIERIEVRPVLAALWSGRLELSTLLVLGADLSQPAFDDLAQAWRARKLPAGPGSGSGQRQGAASDSAAGMGVTAILLPQRIVLDSATWRGNSGVATMFNADARLNLQGLPEDLRVTLLAGPLQGTRLGLHRQADDWNVDVEIAGGTIKGKLQMPRAPGPAPALELNGQLETRNVELGVLLRAQQRESEGAAADGRTAMSGRLQASTNFKAHARDWGGLLDALQSQSRVVVHHAVVHGIDLAQAVRSAGLSRGGQTRLDTLTGLVDTRGRTIDLRNLAASSGALSATGNVTISPERQLQGRVDVQLGAKMVGKAIGVPLQVEGTLDKPQLRLTRAAMAGAAIGTLIMPGVGTGVGATLGEKIGESLKGLLGK